MGKQFYTILFTYKALYKQVLTMLLTQLKPCHYQHYVITSMKSSTPLQNISLHTVFSIHKYI